MHTELPCSGKVDYRKVEYQKVKIQKSRINKVSDATYISDVVFHPRGQLWAELLQTLRTFSGRKWLLKEKIAIFWHKY